MRQRTVFVLFKNKALMMKKKVMMRIREQNRTIAGIALIITALFVLIFPFGNTAAKHVNLSEYYSVSTISELATLRCYYHNVATLEGKPDETLKVISDILTWPFNTLLKTGYKQYWLEYSGIVEIGINANEIKIGEPNAEGVIDIYIPDAKVLNIDADHFSEPIDETGLFAVITEEERMQTYASEQAKMKQEAENDQALLNRAKSNAKRLIEQYFTNIGEEIGVNYMINWVDNPQL